MANMDTICNEEGDQVGVINVEPNMEVDADSKSGNVMICYKEYKLDEYLENC